MAGELVRTHVVMPRELVEAVDQIVGQRRRSQFMAEAVQEKLARTRLQRALRETAGFLNLDNHPEWSTPEKTSAWVRESRANDDRRTSQKLRPTASRGLRRRSSA